MPAKLTVLVCQGPNCSVQGSASLRGWCRDLTAAGLELEHDVTPCTGNCSEAPVVTWNGRYLTQVTPEKLTEQLIADNLF